MPEEYKLHKECAKTVIDKQLIEALISTDTINQPDDKGNPPLYYAVCAKNASLVAVLLKKGANPRLFNPKQYPFLVYATAFNDKETFMTLLNHADIDVNQQGHQNATALLAAAQQGDEDIVDLLLNAGADPLICNEDGTSPFLLAVSNRRLSVANKLYLASPELLNKANVKNIYPLQIALKRNDKTMIEFLLNKGVDPNLLFNEQQTCLDYAVDEGLVEIVRLFLSKGANYLPSTAEKSEPKSVLTRAAYRLRLDVVELLLSYPHPDAELLHSYYDVLRAIKSSDDTDRQILEEINGKIKQKLDSQIEPQYTTEDSQKTIITSIPNSIHFIWLGSFLRTMHQSRILEWKRMNPEHEITLWIDKQLIDHETYQQFKVFCDNHSISLKEVATLHYLMDESVRQWLTRLLAEEIKNYGAISDLYRIYLIKEAGGWYFDTDVIPLLPLPINLILNYGFAINATDDGNEVNFISPSIIVTSVKNSFLDAAFNITILYAQHFMNDFHYAINSKNIIERISSTNLTTGQIVNSAISSLLVSDYPLSHVYNPITYKIFDNKIYQQISLERLDYNAYFEGNICGESSWLHDENGDTLKGLEGKLPQYQHQIVYPESTYQITDRYFNLLKQIKPVSLNRIINLGKTSSDNCKSESPLNSRGFFTDSNKNNVLQKNLEEITDSISSVSL